MGVVYTEETASRASAWLAGSDSKRRTRENTAELHSLYATITGHPAGSCTNCNFSGYVGILQAYVTHSNCLFNPELMLSPSYSFAPGFENETFVLDSYSRVVGANDLTDADAEFMIKNNHAHMLLKNGKPIADEAGTEPKKLLKADHQARYKELHGEDADDKMTVAELIAANDAKQAELDTQD